VAIGGFAVLTGWVFSKGFFSSSLSPFEQQLPILKMQNYRQKFRLSALRKICEMSFSDVEIEP
jgi:hypothetical protein